MVVPTEQQHRDARRIWEQLKLSSGLAQAVHEWMGAECTGPCTCYERGKEDAYEQGFKERRE